MLLLNAFTHDNRVAREARALTEAGHDVRLLAIDGPGLPAREVREGVHVERLALRTRRWRGRLVAPAVHFLEFVRRVDEAVARAPSPPDVVHAHDSNTLYPAWRVARRARARLVYDAHELAAGRSFASSRLSRVYRHLTPLPERMLIRRADAVITVSAGCARVLGETYGIAPPALVHNTPDWDDGPRTDRLRRTCAIPPDARIAVTAGGVLAGRGIEAFLDAVQAAPGVEGVVLGDGPLRSSLQAAAAAGRWRRVHFVRAAPPQELREHLASADVAAALTEDTCENHRCSLPNKLFEGLLAGLPLVVADLPEMGAFVRRTGIGEAVDPRDVRAVAAAISRLAHDGPARSAALAAVAAARPRWHWREEKRSLLAVYERLGR